MKRVLIVTYYWPPSGGPGVQRWLKFVKYLRKFNIEPIVVTVDEKKASYPVSDDSLASEIPEGIKIYRTDSFEPLKLFSSIFKKEKVPYAGIPDRDKMSFVGRTALYVRANYFIPDARKGWNKYAFRKCCEIIESEKIDAVITSSPPHSTQLIGLRLKEKYGLKWLADLRDPWTEIYYYHKLHHSEKAKKKDLQYETDVLNKSDFVTVTSEQTGIRFADKISGDRKKISVITNGFDEEDFQNIKLIPSKEFTITFLGTINIQFGIEHFVEAIQGLRIKFPDIPLRLKFVGNMDQATKQLLVSKVPDSIELIDYVPHKESIQHICNAQLLLLVIPKGKNEGTVPGKTFEYMAAKRNILCLAPKDSSAGKIIESTATGKPFLHEDVSAMSEYIGEMMQRWKRGDDCSVNNNNFKQYSRRNQTAL
ncbi:MAG TPA: glycosyltransferase family 4 protein, partial [Bacteroidia bacterium]|nr:glycosyltransferase family 4 protein [Bacteroidia bacterium]